LALAQSLTAVLEVSTLFYVMSRRIPRLFDRTFLNVLGRMVFATGIMTAVTVLALLVMGPVVPDTGFYVLFPKFAVISLVSLVVYVYVSRSLNLSEADRVIDRATRIFKKIAFGEIRSSKSEE
jgi:peptidoglycan biosynthesis protein MviN/MurJ (putative lipid II flippase)